MRKKILAVGLVLLLVLPLLSSGQGQPATTLGKVQARGKLICGVNNAVPGFGFVDPQGNYSGFDVDYCKALAAAIFNDPSKVEYRPVTAASRFPALQSGEIDVLIRNTTWTFDRDVGLPFNFAPTTFYDGQGFMVRKASHQHPQRSQRGNDLRAAGHDDRAELGRHGAALGDHDQALGLQRRQRARSSL